MTTGRFANGSRVTVAHRKPRHAVATVLAQDEDRAVVATPKPCPYCGPGPCRGTALTANGRDLERFARIHPARGIPARWRISVHPHEDITAADEH